MTIDIIHPMSLPSENSHETLFVVERGQGCTVYDKQDNAYLDGQAGLWCVNVGHNNEHLNQAINKQLDKIAFYNTFENACNTPSQVLAKKILAMLDREQMAKVFYCSGGSDAVDSALKISRLYWKLKQKPQKIKLISLQNGYHGLHFGGVSISGAKIFQEHYGPLIPGCINVPYEGAKLAAEQQNSEQVIKDIKNIIAQEGADSIAALIAEPIQGVGGVVVPPNDFWPNLRRVCDEHDILLIADEVITGFGRSGELFGVRHWDIKPDLMCLAKGLTSGYIPLGATVINQRVLQAFDTEDGPAPFIHGYTYSGHSLACAVGIASLEEVENKNLVQQAKEKGQYFLEKLQKIAERQPAISALRGKGLMLAIDLIDSNDPTNSLNDESPLIEALKQETLQRGLIVRFMGTSIIISPPLIIEVSEIDEMVAILDASFNKIFGH